MKLPFSKKDSPSCSMDTPHVSDAFRALWEGKLHELLASSQTSSLLKYTGPDDEVSNLEDKQRIARYNGDMRTVNSLQSEVDALKAGRAGIKKTLGNKRHSYPPIK